MRSARAGTICTRPTRARSTFSPGPGDAISAAGVFVDAVTARFALYILGFDPAYRHRGPGRALIAHLVRVAIEDGRYRTFDFLRGNEPYKRDFAAIEARTHHLGLTRPGLRAALADAAQPRIDAVRLGIANLLYGGGRSL